MKSFLLGFAGGAVAFGVMLALVYIAEWKENRKARQGNKVKDASYYGPL